MHACFLLYLKSKLDIIVNMADTKTKNDDLEEYLNPLGSSDDPVYLAWKEKEIRSALAEGQDRSKNIPIDKAWEALDLER